MKKIGYYSSELRTYIESFSKWGTSLNNAIEAGRPHLFDFEYQFFNNDIGEKTRFETIFIKNFYTREIEFESISLFKLELELLFNLRMPGWTKLYQSTVIDYDMLNDTKATVTRVREDTTEANTTQQLNGERDASFNTDDTTRTEVSDDTVTINKQLTSDLPQHTVAVSSAGMYGRDYVENNGSNTTAGNTTTNNTSGGGNKEKTVNTGTTDNKQKNVGNETETREGAFGGKSFNEKIADYRANIINVYEIIFKECEILFCKVRPPIY